MENNKDDSVAVVGCIVFFIFLLIIGALIGGIANERSFQRSVCEIVTSDKLSNYNECLLENRKQVLARIQINNIK